MHQVQGISRGLGGKSAEPSRLGGAFQRAVQWLGLVLIGVVLTACGSLQPTKPQEPDLPPTAERRELRLGLALGGGMALHLGAGALDPQIFGAELMARPVVEADGEQTSPVREAQFRGPGCVGG